MTASIRILIVRHGESTWNAVRRWQGQADPPLSERGEAQAARAAIAAAEQGPFDAVVTSTLQRAARTGKVIAERCALPLLEPVVDLSERAAGEWEGLTRSEIEDRYPGFLHDHRRPPGYESDDFVPLLEVADTASVSSLEMVCGGLVSLRIAVSGNREDILIRSKNCAYDFVELAVVIREADCMDTCGSAAHRADFIVSDGEADSHALTGADDGVQAELQQGSGHGLAGHVVVVGRVEVAAEQQLVADGVPRRVEDRLACDPPHVHGRTVSLRPEPRRGPAGSR